MASFDTKRAVDLDIPISSISPDDITSVFVSGHRKYPFLLPRLV